LLQAFRQIAQVRQSLDNASNVRSATPAVQFAWKEPRNLHDPIQFSLDMQWAILTTLRQTGPAAVPALLEALDSADPEVRPVVANALAEMGTQALAATPALRKVLHDPNPFARLNAAVALWMIDGQVPPVLPILIEVLRDSDPTTRVAAASA